METDPMLSEENCIDNLDEFNVMEMLGGEGTSRNLIARIFMDKIQRVERDVCDIKEYIQDLFAELRNLRCEVQHQNMTRETTEENTNTRLGPGRRSDSATEVCGSLVHNRLNGLVNNLENSGMDKYHFNKKETVEEKYGNDTQVNSNVNFSCKSTVSTEGNSKRSVERSIKKAEKEVMANHLRPINTGHWKDSYGSKAGALNPNRRYSIGPYMLPSFYCVPDHTRLLNYIFDESKDWSETIVQTKHTCLTRNEMMSLRPDKFLNGEVINVVVEFLTDKERTLTANTAKTWFLPTRMMKSAIGGVESVSEFVQKHRIVEHFMGSLKHCKKICIPINTVSHWLLVVLCIDEKIAEIWDSMVNGFESVGKHQVPELLANLDKVLHNDIKGSKPSDWSFSSFKIQTLDFLPQQPNHTDCGIFVLRFMEAEEYPKTNDMALYESHEERCKVVMRSVLSPFNEMRIVVGERAAQLNVTPYNTPTSSKRSRVFGAS